MRKFLLLVVMIFGAVEINAQVKVVNAKVGLGLGSIASISPSVTTLDFEASADLITDFWNNQNFRLLYFYSRKFEYFVPQNRTGRYYPYLYGFAAEYLLVQPIHGLIIKEGLGPLAVNDCIFSEENDWVGGIIFSVSAVYVFENSKFGVGGSVNYGITFGGMNPRYLSADISLVLEL
jgi:hypothetical protein